MFLTLARSLCHSHLTRSSSLALHTSRLFLSLAGFVSPAGHRRVVVVPHPRSTLALSFSLSFSISLLLFSCFYRFLCLAHSLLLGSLSSGQSSLRRCLHAGHRLQPPRDYLACKPEPKNLNLNHYVSKSSLSN